VLDVLSTFLALWANACTMHNGSGFIEAAAGPRHFNVATLTAHHLSLDLLREVRSHHGRLCGTAEQGQQNDLEGKNARSKLG